MTIYKLKNKTKKSSRIDKYGIIREYDKKGNLIHIKYKDGYEYWSDFDENNNEIHRKYSDGYEWWGDEKNNSITKKEFNKIWEKVE